ncbi:MAG: DUF979 domain-containing protein [Cetobacterium sp.]|uniref:DUF979 domain-containing protein n=1 Tax=unclassified Cetobacterium TaxID=2630983 RepID=UPI00163BE705|nr:DUF979 domain-containing protein [Cetobacterium sp. 2A]MBC2856759.1 DUF979 domain-containing protein [Cetobacterium sp. 2A]
MVKTILEIMYIAAGLVSITTGVYAFLDKTHKKRYGTSLFWTIFGTIFIFGPMLNPALVGGLLLVMGTLTVTRNVTFGSQTNSDEKYREEQSEKIGNKIFIPALSIGIVAFSVAQFTPLGGLVGLGLGAFVALILTMYYTKESPKYIPYDSSRLLQQMGAAVILPQLLGSLGALFTKAGVGAVIATMMAGVVPEGSKIAGIVIYCIGMAVFTMIMGNAFAAFAVITAGIGLPFLVNIGANPAVVGALGLTSGYCGTLLTPMAANFNVVPVAILEMKNKNGVIATQLPIAITLLIVQMFLMYFLAF